MVKFWMALKKVRHLGFQRLERRDMRVVQNVILEFSLWIAQHDEVDDFQTGVFEQRCAPAAEITCLSLNQRKDFL